MHLHYALVLAAVPPATANGLQDILGNPLVFLAGMLALMYFFVFRPQQQRQKDHIAKVRAVKRGDTVVMSNGMIGKVVRVEELELGIEIAQNVTVKVIKDMVHEVRTRTEPAANDAKS